ncbi:MAG: cytochrome c-type biogenesis protein CcmH [Planctomycetota bacterium]|jgi:cytochrome c-type biogenesis protein CcmH/NrfF
MSKLVILLLLLAPSLMASDITATEPLSETQIEMRYQAVGDQLFCLCGCRDKLLECSHNVCSYKDNERAFLRELSRDPNLTQAQMKEQMVTRFGEQILLAPSDSGLYLLAAAGLLVLIAGFSFGARYLTKAAPESDADKPAPFDDADLDDRIANELKDME